MASDNIEKLLEKYFEAQTTEAEEAQLRQYFSNARIAPHLEAYAPLFQYFGSAKEEQFKGTLAFHSRKVRYAWLSVAAAAVIAFGIYFGKSYQEQREAERVYAQTKQAFSLLAHNLERGQQKMVHLHKFEKTKNKIYKNE